MMCVWGPGWRQPRRRGGADCGVRGWLTELGTAGGADAGGVLAGAGVCAVGGAPPLPLIALALLAVCEEPPPLAPTRRLATGE